MEPSLVKLHYNPKWLEYDFINQSFLDEQVNQYESGSDDNFEHYRYAAFRKVLEAKPAMDDLSRSTGTLNLLSWMRIRTWLKLHWVSS